MNKTIPELNQPSAGVSSGLIAVRNPISGLDERPTIPQALGAVRASFDWQSDTTYVVDDLVLDNNLVWKSLNAANLGNRPSENSFWTNETISTADGILFTTYSTGVFTYNDSIVINNDQFYKLNTPAPFLSSDFDSELLAGNWVLIGQNSSVGYLHPITAFIPLSGVVDDDFSAIGELAVISAGETGNYTTATSIGNQHVYIYVNSITTGGTISITGTKVDEFSGRVEIGYVSVLTIDTTVAQYYQTPEKFYQITDVTLTGIVSLNYDLGIVGYKDYSNTSFTVSSLRADIRISSVSPDLRIRLLKIQDDGNDKFSVVPIEDFGFDGTASNGVWVDHVRASPFNRDYTATTELAPNDSMQVIKATDYGEYFTNDENFIDGTKNEGIILRFEGEPSGGLTNIDHVFISIGIRSTIGSASKLPTITNLVATATGSDSISVTWDAPSGLAEYLLLEYGTDGVSFIPEGIQAKNATGVGIIGLFSPSTEYFFRIKEVGNGITTLTSDYSNIDSDTTDP